MKLAICEDKEDDRERIKASCKKILAEMDVEMELYEFEDGEALLESTEEFDLLILDIVLPGIDGIQIKDQYQRMEKKTLILFVTEHEERMQSAFGIKVFGFIEKCEMEAHMAEIFAGAVRLIQSFFMIDGRIDSRQVVYISAEHVYSRLFMKDGSEELLRISLEKLEKTLGSVNFIRIHKSYLVNAMCIQKWKEKEVQTINGVLPVSVRMKTRAKKQYDKYCMEYAAY